jgi:hypothetical protein
MGLRLERCRVYGFFAPCGLRSGFGLFIKDTKKLFLKQVLSGVRWSENCWMKITVATVGMTGARQLGASQ